MRSTYKGNRYQYRKVCDLPSVPSGFAKRMESRTLLRVEYWTEDDPDTMHVCYAVKGISHSFGDVHRWYYACDENGDNVSTKIHGASVGDYVDDVVWKRAHQEAS